MKNYLLPIIVLVIMFNSCKKYDVQYEGETVLNDTIVNASSNVPIVLMESTRLVLTDRNLKRFKVLDSSINYPARLAMNEAHDRIAYQTFNENIRIIDTNGVLIEVLDNTSNVKGFEYHDNGTLYMLGEQDELSFYGGTIDVPTALKSIDSDIQEVFNVCITEENEIVLIYKTYNNNTFIGHYQNGYLVSNQVNSEWQETYFLRVFKTDENFLRVYARVDRSFGGETFEVQIFKTDYRYIADEFSTGKEIYLSKAQEPYFSISYDYFELRCETGARIINTVSIANQNKIHNIDF